MNLYIPPPPRTPLWELTLLVVIFASGIIIATGLLFGLVIAVMLTFGGPL